MLLIRLVRQLKALDTHQEVLVLVLLWLIFQILVHVLLHVKSIDMVVFLGVEHLHVTEDQLAKQLCPGTAPVLA